MIVFTSENTHWIDFTFAGESLTLFYGSFEIWDDNGPVHKGPKQPLPTMVDVRDYLEEVMPMVMLERRL